MNELTKLTVSEMAAALATGKLSSVELTKSHILEIERQQKLNAFITVDAEGALSAAAAADIRIKNGERGQLLGIPVAVKDMILTKALRTTAASKILSDYIPPYDATVTAKLRSAGAVIIGKTNLDEFAMGSSNENSAFGPVCNPWDLSRVPGGSSGGSAAAVASGCSPLALGTDTGGSIRQPAALCGIVGMKPTYGRVSRYGVIAFASSLDQVGPFARNVADCAAILKVLAGNDTYDAASLDRPVPDYTKFAPDIVKGLKIGIPKEYFISGLDPEIKGAVETALKQYEKLGAKIVDISLPHTELGMSVYYILAPAEASSNLARYDGVRFGHRAEKVSDLNQLYIQSRTEGFGEEVKRRIMIGTFVLSSGYMDAFYLKAQKVRRLVQNDFISAFKNSCDVIMCPTTPTPAFKIGEKSNDPIAMYLSDVFTIPVNLAGLPGLVLPCGLTSNNLPIGLQIIGQPFDEQRMLSVGYAYEQQNSWHRMTPHCSGER